MKITRNWLRKNNACADSLAAWNEAKLTKIDAIDLIEKLLATEKNAWADWFVCTLLATDTKTLPETTLEKCGYKIARDGDEITVNVGEKYVALAGTQKSVTLNGDGWFAAYGDSHQAAVTVNKGGRFWAYGESRQTAVTVNGGGWFVAYGESKQAAVIANGGFFRAFGDSRQTAVTVNKGRFEAFENSKQEKIIRK